MKTKKLTTQQRIEILEDVLKNLKNENDVGGLCLKIKDSAAELFEFWRNSAKKIIPLFTLENARKVTKVKDNAIEGDYWWNYDYEGYDFENRIKFVKWMINKEKEFLK